MIGYKSASQKKMISDDSTMTPELILQNYERAYRQVYGRDARIRHIGGQWYYVSGETVHRVTLLAEIMRLREMARQESPYSTPNRTMIQRLIAHLRGA